MAKYKKCEKTISVAGHFGDREINRHDFVKIWADHAKEMRAISWDDDWMNILNPFMEATALMAGKKFDRAWEFANLNKNLVVDHSKTGAI